MQAPVLVLAAGACVGVALLLFRRRAKKHIEGGDLTIAAMAEQWRQDLLENVVPFWERVSIDSECGGFFTAVDRDGTLLDHSKYAWLQSRAVYMWSKLHNDFYEELPGATTERWLGYACNGARFLEKLKDPTGRLSQCPVMALDPCISSASPMRPCSTSSRASSTHRRCCVALLL